jgi:hypothetical protein
MARKKAICPDFEPVSGGGSAPRCKAQHICENFCFVEKCDPTGAQKPGLHEYDISSDCKKTNETWKDDTGATLDLTLVTIVACVATPPTPTPEPPVPPTPVTLDGQDCEGAALPATGLPGQLTQIIQAPGQVLSVRMCSDDAADFELACGIDPATEHQIQTAYKIVNGEFVLINRWDVVTGLAWTGDATTLEGCGGAGVESDPEVFCDGTNTFYRWFVKKNGVPTGVTYDTDFNAAPYAASSPVTQGACQFDNELIPTISSAFGSDLSTLLPGKNISIQKPDCCAIKVNTSAGSFIVTRKMTGYSTGDFCNDVTVTSVELLSGATCSLDDIVFTTTGCTLVPIVPLECCDGTQADAFDADDATPCDLGPDAFDDGMSATCAATYPDSFE